MLVYYAVLKPNVGNLMHKRQRLNEQVEGTEGALFSGESFSMGDHVRLVNLPAHPGLEGLIGTIVGADPGMQRIHVKLHLNGVIKRVRKH